MPRRVRVVKGPFMGWKVKDWPWSTTVVMLPLGSPRSHARKSISASTWQEGQAPDPLPESLASYKKPGPLTITGGGGFKEPRGVSPARELVDVLTMEMEFEIRFST